jgi:hypothetical protein
VLVDKICIAQMLVRSYQIIWHVVENEKHFAFEQNAFLKRVVKYMLQISK